MSEQTAELEVQKSQGISDKIDALITNDSKLIPIGYNVDQYAVALLCFIHFQSAEDARSIC